MKGYSGEGDGGVIDLGCIITLQTEFLPRLLNGYSSVNERKTEFNINQKPSQELLCGIVEGKHDVAFCAFDALYSDKLHQIPVAEQHLVVAMSPSSPLASKPYLTPGDLKGESLITYRDEVPLGKSVKNLLDSFDIDDVRYVYEDESILAGFAANGSDLALMLDTFFPHTMEDIVVKPLYNNELEKRRYCHTIYLVYCDKNYRPYCVEHFIEYVRGHQLDRSASPSIFID